MATPEPRLKAGGAGPGRLTRQKNHFELIAAAFQYDHEELRGGAGRLETRLPALGAAFEMRIKAGRSAFVLLF